MARILYLTNGVAPYVVGGMQSVSRRHILCLADAGHDLTIIHPGEPVRTDPELPGEQIFISWRKRTWCDTFNPWKYPRDLKAFGNAAARLLRFHKYDVVYSEGPMLGEYIRRPRHERIPIIFHPHGLEMFQSKGSWREDAKAIPMRSIMRQHAQAADIVLSQGAKIDELIVRRLSVKKSKIRFLPNWASIGSAELIARTNDTHNNLLFVGRDEPRKGLSILISALRRVPDANLTIVGPVSGLNGDQLQYVGEINDSEKLHEIYAASDYLVLPSFAEGMPTVILEAFSRGVPVIASDVGAVSMLVVPNETGFLVPPGDSNLLAAVVRKAMSVSRDAYQRMSAKCMAHVAGEFSSERCGQILLSVIDAAIEYGKRST